MVEYQQDPWTIFFAVIITVMVMGFLWFKREQLLRKNNEDNLLKIEEERFELVKLTQEKVGLANDLSELSVRIDEKNNLLQDLAKKETDLILEIDRLKQGLTSEIDSYRQERIAKAEIEASAEKIRLLDELDELIKKKKNDLENELLSRKESAIEEIKNWFEVELAKEKAVLNQKMDAEKQEAQAALDKWQKEETDNRVSALLEKLNKLEQNSSEKIKKWEDGAEQRILQSFERDYFDKLAQYQDDIKFLAQTRDQLTDNIESLKNDYQSMSSTIEESNELINYGLEKAAKIAVESINAAEQKMWQETVEQINAARNEAFERIEVWEEEEKRRLFGTFQAKTN